MIGTIISLEKAYDNFILSFLENTQWSSWLSFPQPTLFYKYFTNYFASMHLPVRLSKDKLAT